MGPPGLVNFGKCRQIYRSGIRPKFPWNRRSVFSSKSPEIFQPICFSKWKIGRDLGANRHFSKWQWVLFSLSSNFPWNWWRVAFFSWNWTRDVCISKIVDVSGSEPVNGVGEFNRVVFRLKNPSWFSWTRLGSNGFGFSSFSSSVAAPSLVLKLDFNTCEWNELYYN